MLNFSTSTVTVNSASNNADAIRKAIESKGLFVLNLDACKAVGDSTYKCFGCFIKQGR